MTQEEKAAYIISQSICAMAEIEGMKVDNIISALRQEYPIRTVDDFEGVIQKYGIDHNSVIGLFRS